MTNIYVDVSRERIVNISLQLKTKTQFGEIAEVVSGFSQENQRKVSMRRGGTAVMPSGKLTLKDNLFALLLLEV